MAKDSVGFKLLSNLRKTSGDFKNLNKELDNSTRKVSDFKRAIDKAFSSSKIISFVSSIKDVTEMMINASSKQASYIEDLNLLNNAFGDTADSAKKLIDYISYTTGWDTSTLTKTLANFRQLTTSVGKFSSETADILADNLLKFSMDISSLYNLSLDQAVSKLNSAIAGQTRAIYSLGGDITIATLQEKAYELGIERRVNTMSRAEKEILIYLTLESQLTNAQGDLSRTLNSVTNQTKVFYEQIKELGRQLGSVFLPILKQILPILNGIMMAINTILMQILSIFGLDAKAWADEFGTGISSGLENLIDDLDGVESASNKAKKSLRGFDKLNNIVSSTASGASAGAGAGIGGIDKNLLMALSEYNMGLDKVSNKAGEIRDKILEWLGYTKLVNQETGEITWDLREGDTNLNRIKTVLEIIGSGVLAKMAIKWLPKIFVFTSKIFGGVSEIFKILGFGGGLKAIFGGLGEFIASLGLPLLGAVTADLYVAFRAVSDAIGDSVKHFSKLEGVSGKNYERLKPIEDAFDNILTTINNISFDNLALTEEESKNIEASIDNLTTTLKNQLNDYVTTAEADLLYLYKTAGVITEEEYKERIEALQQFKKDEEAEIEEEGNKLKENYKKIFDENGNIISSAYADFLVELDNYENKSLENLTMGEADKNKIKRQAEEKSKNESIKYYSELLKQYASDRDNAILKAEEKRDKTIEVAEEMFGKNSEEYDKIKKKAEETYNEEVQTAKDKYHDIYTEFANMNSDINTYIDEDTGDIRSSWEVFWNNLCDIFKNIFNGSWDEVWEGIQTGMDQINEWSERVVLDTWNGIKGVGSWIGESAKGIGKFFGFASGGFVDDYVNSGELWVARENGLPEMVGSFGNRTAVANNDQIVDGITAGVVKGMKAVGGGTSNVTIEAKGDAEGLMNFITFKQKQQNRQYGL